jgi:hypothetical protein
MNEDSDQDDPYDEKLSDLMRRAEAGDLLAAREVAETLALIVSTANTYRDPSSPDGLRRIVVPVPDFIRDYLSRALLKIASGTDARDAFHLRKRGRRQFWAHRDKILAVDIMQQLVEQGAAVNVAVEAAVRSINSTAKKLTAENPTSPWKKFATRRIEEHTLLKWYYERNPDAAKI